MCHRLVHRVRNQPQMNQQSGRNRNDQLIYANRLFFTIRHRWRQPLLLKKKENKPPDENGPKINK